MGANAIGLQGKAAAKCDLDIAKPFEYAHFANSNPKPVFGLPYGEIQP
jgi:hypothetical protein